MTVARVLLIVEGSTDAAAAQQLLDRALVESEDWVEPALLTSLREYVRPDGLSTFLPWTKVKSFAQEQDCRVRPQMVHGNFGGKHGPDAVQARWGRIATVASRADATVWLRDADNQPERAEPLVSVEADPPCPFAWGVAVPTIEAWLVGCFVPGTSQEEVSLTQLRMELPFDPVTKPERLSPTGGRHPAKKIAAQLGLDNPDRRAEALDGPLDRIRRCASNAGLPDFISRLEQVALAIVRLRH